MLASTQVDSHLPRWLFVGFSGHRNLQHPDQVTSKIAEALNDLALGNARLAGVCSAASGADTLFAEEMLRRNCPVSVVLPFPCDRFKEDFNGDPGGWTRSLSIMGRAVSVDVVHNSGIDQLETLACISKPPAETTDDPAPQAYMEAGYRCVDQADVLLAVWNEKEGKGFGGTADAVHYAIQIGMPLIIINPETGTVTHERLPERIQHTPTPLPPIDDSRALVKTHLDHVDESAKKHAPRARQLIRWCLYFHLLASVVASAAAIFRVEGWLAIAAALLDLLVLITAFVMLRIRARSYEIWLLHRAEAEVCRSFLATWDIRRQSGLAHQPHPALPRLRHLFQSLRLLRQLDKSAKTAFEQARADYEVHRIADQLDYFRKWHKHASSAYAFRKRMMAVSTGGAIACSMALVVVLFRDPSSLLHHLLEVLVMSLPLLTTALALLLITDESSRREIRYREMIAALEYYEPRVKACRTWQALSRLATSVEAELLQEILEWHSFIRHTEQLH